MESFQFFWLKTIEKLLQTIPPSKQVIRAAGLAQTPLVIVFFSFILPVPARGGEDVLQPSRQQERGPSRALPDHFVLLLALRGSTSVMTTRCTTDPKGHLSIFLTLL